MNNIPPNRFASFFGIKTQQQAEIVAVSGACYIGVVSVITAVVKVYSTTVAYQQYLYLYGILAIGAAVAKFFHWMMTECPKEFRQVCDHTMGKQGVIILPWKNFDASVPPPMKLEPKERVRYNWENVGKFLLHLGEKTRGKYRPL